MCTQNTVYTNVPVNCMKHNCKPDCNFFKDKLWKSLFYPKDDENIYCLYNLLFVDEDAEDLDNPGVGFQDVRVLLLPKVSMDGCQLEFEDNADFDENKFIIAE